MKLLLITSLKEYQKRIVEIVDAAGIEVFSISDIAGFKDHRKPVSLDNWFSSGSEHADSIFLFSVTDDAKADHALTLVHRHNAESKSGFPIQAFILPVEKSTHDLQLQGQQ